MHVLAVVAAEHRTGIAVRVVAAATVGPRADCVGVVDAQECCASGTSTEDAEMAQAVLQTPGVAARQEARHVAARDDVQMVHRVQTRRDRPSQHAAWSSLRSWLPAHGYEQTKRMWCEGVSREHPTYHQVTFRVAFSGTEGGGGQEPTSVCAWTSR